MIRAPRHRRYGLINNPCMHAINFFGECLPPGLIHRKRNSFIQGQFCNILRNLTRTFPNRPFVSRHKPGIGLIPTMFEPAIPPVINPSSILAGVSQAQSFPLRSFWLGHRDWQTLDFIDFYNKKKQVDCRDRSYLPAPSINSAPAFSLNARRRIRLQRGEGERTFQKSFQPGFNDNCIRHSLSHKPYPEFRHWERPRGMIIKLYRMQENSRTGG